MIVYYCFPPGIAVAQAIVNISTAVFSYRAIHCGIQIKVEDSIGTEIEEYKAEMKTWKEMEDNGWKRRERGGFERPNGKVVNRKRDLTVKEKVEIGDLLFPGLRLKRMKNTDVSDKSVCSNSNTDDSYNEVTELPDGEVTEVCEVVEATVAVIRTEDKTEPSEVTEATEASTQMVRSYLTDMTDVASVVEVSSFPEESPSVKAVSTNAREFPNLKSKWVA